SRDEMRCVAKNGPAQIGRHASIAGAQIETLERLSTEEQHHREQNENQGNSEGDARSGTFPERERAEPKRTARDEKQNAGARKIENDADDNHGQRDEPENPAFAAMTNVFLSAGENDDRGDSEKVRRLVAIRERPEPAFVMPERQRGVPGAERDAEHGQT